MLLCLLCAARKGSCEIMFWEHMYIYNFFAVLYDDQHKQGLEMYQTMGPLVPENFGVPRKYFELTFVKHFR